LPGVKVVKEMDLVSDYRADPFGAEQLRSEYIGKNSTDTSSDNDTFMFSVVDNDIIIEDEMEFSTAFNAIKIPSHGAEVNNFPKNTIIEISGTALNNGRYIINSSGSIGSDLFLFIHLDTLVTDEPLVSAILTIQRVELYRPAYTITGVPYPGSIYNTELSVKRGILNNGPYLRSILDKSDDKDITFLEADKNKELVAGGIAEKDNIPIGSLGDKLFLPYFIKIRTTGSINLVQQMEGNPYGLVEFIWNKQTWHGFMFDGGIEPAKLDSQEWVLLSGPNNNFSNFNP